MEEAGSMLFEPASFDLLRSRLKTGLTGWLWTCLGSPD